MKRIEDERIKFYLKHRRYIEEWANTRNDLCEFVHEFYWSLVDELQVAFEACDDIAGDELSIRADDTWKDWPGIVLRRTDWPRGQDDPAVRFQWRRGKGYEADFSPGRTPTCGVRAPNHHEHFSSESCREDYPNRSNHWPVYDYVEVPQGEFWEGDNIATHRKHVIELILNAWRDLAPLVDEALDRAREPSVESEEE